MNAHITIGFKKDNKAEIICQPSVPYKEQKAILHKINAGFSYVEIWSKSNGIVKRKRIKESSKIPKVANVPKVPNTSKVSNISNQNTQLTLTAESDKK